ncbi:hypothetical protein QJS83_16105 [Bdellovibrio sp. 22V]|uniref:Ppx/GppA phosphatase family protein n=1 Tax=Bdellovibrio TaxID=958 RepID=UPI002543A085|nr:hypothetical protein [Bdellovibrio sp. 22V]WII71987.1 hypothetical protein QJS83_16105 [Bdellovibrio sp. 22V]
MRKSVFLLVYFFCEVVFANPCQEKQGALDFGSGTTKAFAAVVDVCEKKIVQVLYEDRLALAFNEALEKSEKKEIPLAMIEESAPRIQNMLEKMKEHDVKKVTGIATSVFRVAKNGKTAIALLAKKISVPIEIISQDKEAELGYWSALSKKNFSAKDPVIVWDIGGGSMQMYARRKGRVYIYEGNLASVTFKNKILEVLQFKDPKKFSSPNPIGAQRQAALQLAKNHAYLNVPLFFKNEAAKAHWIGVGGVLSMSVQRQVAKGQDSFSQEELDRVLKERAQLSDAQIDSDYRISDISNLALVLGYMQALKIAKVETAQASLGQGLLLYNLHHIKLH